MRLLPARGAAPCHHAAGTSDWHPGSTWVRWFSLGPGVYRSVRSESKSEKSVTHVETNIWVTHRCYSIGQRQEPVQPLLHRPFYQFIFIRTPRFVREQHGPFGVNREAPIQQPGPSNRLLVEGCWTLTGLSRRVPGRLSWVFPHFGARLRAVESAAAERRAGWHGGGKP